MSKVCPKCKRETKNYDKIEELYGSPLMICETCKSECLSNKREIALSGVSFWDRTLIRMRNIFILCSGIAMWVAIIKGGIFWLVEGALQNLMGGGIGTVIAVFVFGGIFIVAAVPVSIWEIIKDIRTYKSRLKFFEREKEESARRCSNREYVNKLVTLGYKLKKRIK